MHVGVFAQKPLKLKNFGRSNWVHLLLSVCSVRFLTRTTFPPKKQSKAPNNQVNEVKMLLLLYVESEI